MITVDHDLNFTGVVDVGWLRWFLTAHAVAGIEEVRHGSYRRTVQLTHGPAVLSISLRSLSTPRVLRLHLTDPADLTLAVQHARKLLGLDHDPAPAEHFLRTREPFFNTAIECTPGLRIPGALNLSEIIFRTMIGQQISIAAAQTHTARLVQNLGSRFSDPDPSGGLCRLFPTPIMIADQGETVLRGPAARVQAVVSVARILSDDPSLLASWDSLSAPELRTQLLSLPGIGPWTADYILLRFLMDPDIMLKTDLIVRRGAELAGIEVRNLDRFMPWRTYASMRLWHHMLRLRKVL